MDRNRRNYCVRIAGVGTGGEVLVPNGGPAASRTGSSIPPTELNSIRDRAACLVVCKFLRFSSFRGWRFL